LPPANLVNRNILTVFKYFRSLSDGYSIDTLSDCSQNMFWNTSFQRNDKDQIIVSRKLKRMQMGFDGESRFFFDSDLGTKLQGGLSIINQVSDRLLNRQFVEVLDDKLIIQKNDIEYNFHGVGIFDTIKYVSSIVFFQSIPLKSTWTDTCIYKNQFFERSFSVLFKNADEARLSFNIKQRRIIDSSPSRDSSDPSVLKVSIVEGGLETNGIISINISTHIINFIIGEIKKNVHSDVSNRRSLDNQIYAKFELENFVDSLPKQSR